MLAKNNRLEFRNRRRMAHRRLAAVVTVFFVMLLVVPIPSFAAPALQAGMGNGPAPQSMRIQRQQMQDEDVGPSEDNTGAEQNDTEPRPIIIDTDPGVDDAVAIVALLSQHLYSVEVLGIATVAGNADALAGANNALNILNELGRTDIPVAIGAHAPLVRTPSSTGKVLHGPDGLWGLGLQSPNDLSGLVQDAVGGFYCARPSWEGATLIALGPLTNVARAVDLCPETMRTIGEIVFLGGAKFGGNVTPVAEYNVWQDPEAFAAVLDFVKPAQFGAQPQPALTVVPFDAFSQLAITSDDLSTLVSAENAATRFLFPALSLYVAIQEANGGKAGLADPVAIAIALDIELYGRGSPALIAVMLPQPPQVRGKSQGRGNAYGTDPDADLRLTRGMTIVGITPNERISMIADDEELSALANAFADSLANGQEFDLEAALGAIFLREPDSALFITDINESLVAEDLFEALMNMP